MIHATLETQPCRETLRENQSYSIVLEESEIGRVHKFTRRSNRMGILNKAADVAQKGAVLGLMSLLGFQVYQIASKVVEKTELKRNDHVEIMAKINAKVEEESKYKNSIDKIPDRFDPEDDSYLKNVPKLQTKR